MECAPMAKELKDIGEEYRKASQDSFASVIRSVGEIHRGFQGIASEMTEQSKRSVKPGACRASRFSMGRPARGLAGRENLGVGFSSAPEPVEGSDWIHEHD